MMISDTSHLSEDPEETTNISKEASSYLMNFFITLIYFFVHLMKVSAGTTRIQFDLRIIVPAFVYYFG